MFEQRPEGEGDLYEPVVPLPDMTKKAIDTLSKNKKGFFLMVEEEGTDEMSHENNAEKMIKAGQELDKSVAVAKEYAKEHPNTLVLVVADHECGGLSIENVDSKDESGDGISKEDGPFKVVNHNHPFIAGGFMFRLQAQQTKVLNKNSCLIWQLALKVTP